MEVIISHWHIDLVDQFIPLYRREFISDIVCRFSAEKTLNIYFMSRFRL